MLTRVASGKFYKINIIVAVAALVALIFAGDKYLIFALYGVVGFTIANIFPIIYGMAIQKSPDKANEISGLMITGVFGGAILPFFMGLSSDFLGSQLGAIIVILLGALYLMYLAFSKALH